MHGQTFSTLFLGLLTSIAVGAQARADTIRVPEDYSTIQEAIDAALNGDTVLVAAGTYNESIRFKGKAIMVCSELGPNFTVIHGTRSGSVVLFDDHEGLDSVLKGFTLTGGCGTHTNCFKAAGGGICCIHNASPTIVNNMITENKGDAGGGIYVNGGCNPQIRNNVISFNNVWSPHPSSPPPGGGIYCRSTAVITGNLIAFNTAMDGIGGGLYFENNAPRTTNNMIYGNWASEGGGIACCYTEVTLANNTITENRAFAGGGIDLVLPSTMRLLNTILWGNDAWYGPEASVGEPYDPSCTLEVDHCDVEGNVAGIYVAPGSSLQWGGANLDTDPCFVEPAVQDYHLSYYSPCRSAGDPEAAPSEDFEGDPREGTGGIDLGADAFATHLYYTGGEMTPGAVVDIKVTGEPALPVFLCLGSGILNPPVPTPYGDFYLQWPLTVMFLGCMPSKGVAVWGQKIPDSTPSLSVFPFQALAGMELTNLMVLVVQ